MGMALSFQGANLEAWDSEPVIGSLQLSYYSES